MSLGGEARRGAPGPSLQALAERVSGEEEAGRSEGSRSHDHSTPLSQLLAPGCCLIVTLHEETQMALELFLGISIMKQAYTDLTRCSVAYADRMSLINLFQAKP